jgi:hypothetical protein
MSVSFRYALVTAAACAVVGSSLAEPASAAVSGSSSHNVGVSTPGRSVSSAAAPAGAPGEGSRYLAGYRATDPDHVSEVVIKAVDVPAANCSDPRFEGVALGAGSQPALKDVEYFAGILVTCVSGQQQYLMDAKAGDSEQATGIEPGDQAQIVITLNCDAYPSCEVFSSATSLDTGTSVSVDTTIDVTTDSAVFGAFPMSREGSSRPAPVPDFGTARVLGCLFDNHLLNRSAQRISRVRHGHAVIRASNIHVGSFRLTRRV